MGLFASDGRRSQALHPAARTGGSAVAEAALLDRGHCGEVQDFLARLDRDSRCRRFGHAASDEAVRDHAFHAFEQASCVIGVFVDLHLRGVIELYSCAPHPLAEVALVVEQDWRRRGLGWLLLSAAMQWAEHAGETSLRLIFTRENWPMRQLAAKAHARLDLVLDEICADITPLAPSPHGLTAEMIARASLARRPS